MKPKDLSSSIASTYKWLRIGVGVIAFAFPLILWAGGQLLADLELQGSLSAYYHAGNALQPGGTLGDAVIYLSNDTFSPYRNAEKTARRHAQIGLPP